MDDENVGRLEELAQFLFSIYLFSLLPFAWWVFSLFIFAPDSSLLGVPLLSLIEILLFGLSSFDRVIGFNLMEVSIQAKPAAASISQSP